MEKYVQEYILRIKGGSNSDSNDDLVELEKMEQLRSSIISKTSQSLRKKSSINKILKRVLKMIDPVISSPKFWKIVQRLETPLKSELSDPS